MRVCIVGSCGKKKRTQSPNAPKCEDLSSTEDLLEWRQKLSELAIPARDMYMGNQARELVKGVDLLRKIPDLKVVLLIISAGFGLLHEHDPVPPYECSFSGMKKADIISRSKLLSIRKDFKDIISHKTYDLIYLAVGKNYLTALGDGWIDIANGTIIIFDRRKRGENLIFLPSDNATVHAFSQFGHKVHGTTGFKGDLLRILASNALKQKDPYSEIMAWTEPLYLTQLIHELCRLDYNQLKLDFY